MSLSPPAARRPMHARHIQCDGYLRDDGLWDIEARLVDRKPFAYTEFARGPRQPGQPVHDMQIRLTVSHELLVQAVEVAMPSVPYDTCVNARPQFQGLVGKRIDKSWRASVRDAVGAERGCTHARELLFPMATTAFQTLYGWREGGADRSPPAPDPAAAQTRPSFVGGCIGWATDGPVVARFFPQFSTAATPKEGA